MSTEFPGFSGPAASTEAPLEMLAACHIRIERHCATLRRQAAHLTEHGADADARTAAMHVMRCFDTAAEQHHADEEVDLFPRSEEHTSELPTLMRISYAVICLTKNNIT